MTFGARARNTLARICVALALVVGAGPVTAAAQGGSLTDAAGQIEALIGQGRTDEAVTAARAFLRQVTDQTGFGVTNAQLITAPATGFGVFDPRVGNSYGPGEPVYAYVEVYGFSLTPQPDGSNRLLFDVEFTVDSVDGEQMTDAMISMGAIQLESYSTPVDGYFHLTYRVTGVQGAVILRTHVTDRASGQETEFTLPVEFSAPTPAPAKGANAKILTSE